MLTARSAVPVDAANVHHPLSPVIANEGACEDLSDREAAVIAGLSACLRAFHRSGT